MSSYPFCFCSSLHVRIVNMNRHVWPILALICTVQQMSLVAKPGKSDELHTLVRQGMKEEAATCCMACGVRPGTKVIQTEWGIHNTTIRVLDGPEKGCAGDVPTANLECDPDLQQ